MPSAYAAVKAALVTRLDARSGLTDVKVLDRLPDKAEEIQGDSGKWEMISFDSAEGDTGVVVVAGASNIIFDDDYIQTCFIQVLIPDSEGTQQAADTRADELLHEVYAELAAQAAWDYGALGLGPDDFEYVIVTPAGHRHEPSHLSHEGHAAKVELGIRVRARYTFNS